MDSRSTPSAVTAAPPARRAVAVIATTGDVDHGKTALAHRLAGSTAEDRRSLGDEGPPASEARIAFEIGDDRFVVVDSPSHASFARTLLAGRDGVDLALFVIAADEGVTPRTAEDVDAAHLLGVRDAVFVLTKADLSDEGRLADLRGEIGRLASDTAFAASPVLAVSSASGAGVDELRAEIGRRTANRPAREPGGWLRLPVDHAVALQGSGLVVTGTVLSGAVREGETVALRPGELVAAVEAVRVQGRRVDEASVGERVTVSLATPNRDEARRGQVLVDPRIEFTTDRFDCWLEARDRNSGTPLRSFDRVRVQVGAEELGGRIIALDDSAGTAAGARGFCQITLDADTIVATGDRLLIRTETAPRATAGGIVLHPFADRHRSGDPSLKSHLEILRHGDPPRRLEAFLDLLHEFAAPAAFVAQGLDRTIEQVVEAARAARQVVPLPSESDPRSYTTVAKWERLIEVVTEVLEHHHATHPLEAGMEAEALRSRLNVPLPPRVLRPVLDRLVASRRVTREGLLLRLPRHRVQAGDRPVDDAARVLDAIVAGGFMPPDLRQLERTLEVSRPELLGILLALEKEAAVVRVGDDLWFATAALEDARHLLVEFVDHRGEITVADYRTLLAASRKYALALTDYFDRCALTLRVGDARRLRR